jgi:hypothetical protein
MTARPFLVLVAAFVGAFAVPSATATPSASTASCTTTAEGPFLYVDTVIPVTSVRCDTAQRRLRIETELTRDGVVIASTRRACRNTDVCYATVDASAPDEPGDQVWCTSARGYVGSTFVGAARACEAEAF